MKSAVAFNTEDLHTGEDLRTADFYTLVRKLSPVQVEALVDFTVGRRLLLKLGHSKELLALVNRFHSVTPAEISLPLVRFVTEHGAINERLIRKARVAR